MPVFSKSEQLLDRALKVIPGGTGTFSKSKTQYPRGGSPFFIERGKGSHVWDVDGNEYVDFVSGLTPIILGYADSEVDEAVRTQMNDGVIFSLPSPLEVIVSELICSMVPGAEMVKFGKNGSDATSMAIRVARAYTGRDHVATCGYHGWADWYIGATARNLGVPQAVKSLTHPFVYNDIDSLNHIFKDHPEQVSCVIMEPMNREWPKDQFLNKVKELAHKNHALFILDEVITGFRFARGGAQEYFNITADLVTFGKAIANGYPLSAVTGPAEIMSWFEKIHCSFTNSGECLSLAAALATLTKINEGDVIERIAKLGIRISENMSFNTGHPAWSHFDFDAWSSVPHFKTKLIQELIRRGILMIGTHNIQYSHTDEDIDLLLSAYDEILRNIDFIELYCEPLKPLFRIR